MSSSDLLYLNSSADWTFSLADVRAADNSPLDLTPYTVSATFRPEACRGIDIADCATGSGISVTAATTTTGSDVTIVVTATQRTWKPPRPTLVIADVLASLNGAELWLKRLQFIATLST